MPNNRSVLIVSPFFSPNTGGVETHLDDLVRGLCNRGHEVYVQTYSPITTPGVGWQSREDRDSLHIRRYFWPGGGFFHKVENSPILDFLYITPYLFLRVFLFMLRNHKKIDIIHAHGLNAALIANLIMRIFKKQFIVSIHAIYSNSNIGNTSPKIKSLLNKAKTVLTLSQASKKQLLSLGVEDKRLKVFRYWIDLDLFKPLPDKKTAKSHLGLDEKFTVFYAGRLIEKKGVKLLLDVAKSLPQINFIFAGSGPLQDYLEKESKKEPGNIRFIGRIENRDLSLFYNAAEILCIPSEYEEGYGRVAMEAVACGLPVVGSNLGGINEAVDSSVSILQKPEFQKLKDSILNLSENRDLYFRLQKECRPYAEKNFSEANINTILTSYEE